MTGPLEVHTACGDVWLERAGATAEVNTASGDVQLRQAGRRRLGADAPAATSPIGSAAASVHVQTASGDIAIGSAAAGEVSTKTASGDTQVGVAAGVGVYLDLSSLTGSISSELDETDGGDDVALQVSCRSVSGDIRITRADPARRRNPRGSPPSATQSGTTRQGARPCTRTSAAASARSTSPTCTGPPTEPARRPDRQAPGPRPAGRPGIAPAAIRNRAGWTLVHLGLRLVSGSADG